MAKKQVAAIVQARMGSSRLPGKILMNILDRPMLWHLLMRLKQSRLIDRIVVATTINKIDDAVEGFCQQNKFDCFRGSEEDVLDRYYQAAKQYRATTIIRITADCPLLDSEVIDKVVVAYINNQDKFDGASNVVKRSYPRGLDTEVISFISLQTTWEKAFAKPDREHVTPYIYAHPELFKISSVENKEDLSHLRWTVDEEKDLIFVREIYSRLYEKNNYFRMQDILKVLTEEPLLKEINKGVAQKSVK